jgi:hypothetical protein
MEIIRQVRVNKATGHRYVTIPMAQIDIQKNDFVKIIKYQR